MVPEMVQTLVPRLRSNLVIKNGRARILEELGLPCRLVTQVCLPAVASLSNLLVKVGSCHQIPTLNFHLGQSVLSEVGLYLRILWKPMH